jgi:hypothetical protein
MWFAFMAARMIGSAAGKRTPHGPKYVQPYKGPHRNVYNVTRFLTTTIALSIVVLMILVAVIGKFG